MRHLPVHFFSNCLFLQHNYDIAGIIRLKRGEKIDNLIKADAGRADINAVLADATALPAHLLHQSQQRRAEGHDVRKHMPLEHRETHLKKRLGRKIGLDDKIILTNYEHRKRQDI